MKRSVFFIIFLLLIIIGSIWFLVQRFESKAPIIIPSQEIKFLNFSNKPQGLSFRIEDQKSGLRNIVMSIQQDKLQVEVYKEEFAGSVLWGRGNTHYKDIQININPQEMKLKEGEFTLIIEVHDYSWRHGLTGNTSVLEKSIIIDRTPPSLSSLSVQHYLNQGGTGFVVYQTSSDSVRSGVYVEDLFFWGVSVKSQVYPDAHVVYFAIPYDQSNPKVELFSQDAAGNEARAGFYYLIREKKFRKDSINLSDSFLQTKMPQFYSIDESLRGLDLVDVFLKINNKWRIVNNQKITELCQKSGPGSLWEGKFLRLPDATPSAMFADVRSYVYKEKKIDEQTHLGVDLASLAHSPVPAANNGLVVFHGNLGIYGQSIIIDHGQNIFSMYSHLNDFSVQTGQRVNKGDTIAHTGDTGLAGGDHLHFSMMVGGIFVNPIEWWDEHWINDNITLKLNLLTPPQNFSG